MQRKKKAAPFGAASLFALQIELLSKCFVCLSNDGLECLRIVNCDLREHLAVEKDTGLAESLDEAAVGRTVLACSGVDTLNPESAVLALLELAVLGCHNHGALDRGSCLRVVLATISVKTLGEG